MSDHFRVVAVRRHKSCWFLDAMNSDGRQQLVVDATLARQTGISRLSLLQATVHPAVNDRGQPVLQVTQVDSCRSPRGNSPQQTGPDNLLTGATDQILFTSLLLAATSEHLSEQGYLRILSRSVVNERGTSLAPPARISGRYVSGFLKITHELELKEVVACTLRPAFEIGYVIRDVHNRRSSPNEYLLLELVNPVTDVSVVRREILTIVSLAAEVADQLNLPHADYSNIEVRDVDQEVPHLDHAQRTRWFRELKPRIASAILLNSPVDSPLARSVRGHRKETIWIVNGKSIAHGYRDETDYESFHKGSRRQEVRLRDIGVDGSPSSRFLNLLKLGAPESVSIGFGVDRFIRGFLAKKSISQGDDRSAPSRNTAGAARWCSRSSRAATASEGRRSRPECRCGP